LTRVLVVAASLLVVAACRRPDAATSGAVATPSPSSAPSASSAVPVRFGFGRPATDAEIRAWDIDVRPDGAGLPPGRGTVEEGAALYVQQCQVCHGVKGRGGEFDALAGREPRQGFPFGKDGRLRELRTIGNYWPYATTLYDYIHRAMPADAPQSLTPDEVYALTAYLLFLNGIVPEDAVMDAQSLPQVVMPNHAGFTSPDPRPDVFATADETPPGTPAA
jgi:mono/diheme cytochrome c family protein